MQKNKMEEVNFKDLTIKEQVDKLEKAFEDISQQIYQERSAEILSGSIEIEDISYNMTSDSKVIYDITIRNANTGEETHEFYNKDLEKINIDKSKIQDMELLGYDTSVAEKQLEEIENLKNNPDKISLSKIKEHDKEIEGLSNSLGIPRKDLEQVTTIDANQELKIKADELGGSQFDRISGTEKVSMHYNVRDVIGGDFVSYQIIKTINGSYKLFGIDKNGYAQEIGNDLVEKMNVTDQSVKLIQENGEVKESKILVAFRIKSASDIDKDQVIGLCDDGTSKKTSFYGRGAISNDEIVGENIASKTYSENRVKTEHLMDTYETDKTEFNNTDEYIEEVAEKYDVDEDELREEVVKSTDDFGNVTKEDVEDIADFMSREPSLEPKIDKN